MKLFVIKIIIFYNLKKNLKYSLLLLLLKFVEKPVVIIKIISQNFFEHNINTIII